MADRSIVIAAFAAISLFVMTVYPNYSILTDGVENKLLTFIVLVLVMSHLIYHVKSDRELVEVVQGEEGQ